MPLSREMTTVYTKTPSSSRTRGSRLLRRAHNVDTSEILDSRLRGNDGCLCKNHRHPRACGDPGFCVVQITSTHPRFWIPAFARMTGVLITTTVILAPAAVLRLGVPVRITPTHPALWIPNRRTAAFAGMTMFATKTSVIPAKAGIQSLSSGTYRKPRPRFPHAHSKQPPQKSLFPFDAHPNTGIYTHPC